MFKKRKKDKKVKFEDNGMTVSNMNVPGMPWYRSEEQEKEKKAMIELKVTRKERRAMIAAAFAAYLPVFLTIIGTFTILFLIFYFLIK